MDLSFRLFSNLCIKENQDLLENDDYNRSGREALIFLNSLAAMCNSFTYIHWPLQPFRQDYSLASRNVFIILELKLKEEVPAQTSLPICF